MKKLLTILMAAAMLLSVCALTACGGATEEAAEEAEAEVEEVAEEATEAAAETVSGGFTTVEAGKLHMSTNAAFPPYEMTADDGSFVGIDVEVATAIAEKLGLELVVDDMDFDAALTAAQQNKSDMVMAGVTVTDERLAVMDFSDSYATGVQVVIAAHEHEYRYDAPAADRPWAQVVGGGPEMGVVRGKPAPERFPTVIEGKVGGGELKIVVHDVLNGCIAGVHTFRPRA